MSTAQSFPKYEYRRRLPHYQKSDRALFVTFCTHGDHDLPPPVRDLILAHCRYDHGRRILLHAAVVMPDHVHLLFSMLRDDSGWPYELKVILQA